MPKIYVAFVDTPGLFASVIRHVLHQKYIHVVLSFDEKLDNAYSFGRRNPFIPFFAGMEKENKMLIARAFPEADYMVCEVDCTDEQKKWLQQQVAYDYERRWHTHYAVCSLPFIWRQKAFFQKRHYTCSSYLAWLLKEVGIVDFQKHFSIVTPKDFYLWPEKSVIYEGRLTDFVTESTAVTEVIYEG